MSAPRVAAPALRSSRASGGGLHADIRRYGETFWAALYDPDDGLLTEFHSPQFAGFAAAQAWAVARGAVEIHDLTAVIGEGGAP